MTAPTLTTAPTEESQRIAARNFEYATRAEAGGNLDLAIASLRVCCRLVPGHLPYRQALRKAEKARYGPAQRGSALAPLTTLFSRWRLGAARRRGRHLRALELGEAILARDPWDRGAQLAMAEAAAALGWPVTAIWLLQQAREKHGKDPQVNRALARLLEQQGYLQQAGVLWEMVRQAAPRDVEARDKAKFLAATETIARGNYEGAVAGEEPTLRAPAAPTPPPQTRPAQAAKTAPPPAGLPQAPLTPDGALQLAALSRRAGDPAEARRALERAVQELGPRPELTLALTDLDIEPLRHALARTEERLRSRPDEPTLQKARDELAVEVNALELAWCRRRVEHDPTDRTAHFDLGVRLLRAGQLDEAITELQTARSEPRLRCKALVQLGHCFAARQNWPLAKRNFEEALQLLPAGEEAQRKELLFHLAQGHADAGDLERALELATDLANLDFAYRGIGRRLDEWQARAQQPGRR